LLVSVICPTFERHRFHPALYAQFHAQQWDELELLVLDDTPAPSPFFTALRDPRVRYFHSEKRRSVGAKRNALVGAARGEVIVAFDDDDHYAPAYVPHMVRALGDAALVKLDGWYGYAVPHDTFFYWDTTRNLPQHFEVRAAGVRVVRTDGFAESFISTNRDGFGFSYVFRRDAAQAHPFPKQNFGEDEPFVRSLREAGRRCGPSPTPSASCSTCCTAAIYRRSTRSIGCLRTFGKPCSRVRKR
jgi:glycosyltransferase involved in cell wall biosynthesis